MGLGRRWVCRAPVHFDRAETRSTAKRAPLTIPLQSQWAFGPVVTGVDGSLLDRAEERKVLDELIAAAGAGLSGVCVLHGAPGMGKTRLLEYAVHSATEVPSVWIAGVETEGDLGYAALHRLLRPHLTGAEGLPPPQRRALAAAFGLVDDGPADRFMVGLASLSVLADLATDAGLVCIVDDAQWIDQESLEALTFVGRRLAADRIALLFGARDDDELPATFDGLPRLHVRGLPDSAALELLSSQLDGGVEADLARRVVTATSGCPLALVELASELTEDQLRGGRVVSDPLPIGRRLEEHFLRKVRALDDGAQLVLLVAAAETSGDLVLVRAAAAKLGAADSGEDAAVASGLVSVGTDISFRHPLIRSAVYAGASEQQRREVHETLAGLIDRATDPDRRASHLAAAARAPDDGLATELEQAAVRAGRRGGYAAEASFLHQSAQLTPAEDPRSRRLLSAATAALNAGLPQRAEVLLGQARAGLKDAALRAEAMRLDGRLRVPLAQPPAAPALLLEAARAFEPLDTERARRVLLEALDAGVVSLSFTTGTTLEDIARAALSVRRETAGPPSLVDLLLDGAATLLASGYAAAVPLLREAAAILRDGPVSREDVATWFNFGLAIANELWDDETYGTWVRVVEQRAREEGALIALQVALIGRAKDETRAGRFDAAEATYDEAVDITRAIGGIPEFYELLKVDLFAWRGDEPAARTAATALREGGAAIGSGPAVAIADLALATLALGHGRYEEALTSARHLTDEFLIGWTCQGLAITVESAVRVGDVDLARTCLRQLAERATAAATPWALGQLARAGALLAPDEAAESLYQQALAELGRTSLATESAHTHLVYGEWLRRQNRRADARQTLGVAYEMFSSMGAGAFARRAHIELAATGERVRRRSVETQNDLTPQETQVARLASAGATNSEIAGRMFISANTVDYHLRKVYRKLGIASRRDLDAALQDGRRPPRR